MKVLVHQRDLSDDYLRFAVQIGADGIDIHNAESLPGFAEQGYPHLEELRILKARGGHRDGLASHQGDPP